MSVRVYCASAMTGRTGKELVEQSKNVHACLYSHGIEILDPILSEHVQPVDKPLHNPPHMLSVYWKRDKAMIRKAHVILDLTGAAKSEGVSHEIGYARFSLWKPVVRIYPNLGPSIARFEDDLVVDNLEEAAVQIRKRWGTFSKRLKWRLHMLNKCLPKWILYQLLEFK